ncbi:MULTISPECIES: DUF4153 domain-containing protein [Pseudoalteromonas]|jgi:hypothetical protein|uniref:DUF4153 domain-containing protein n=2 Tax=Pseudoalteromonas arctica TaxID=394751 RepID=A0A290S6D1_9GAMM|nr:MULTISPECIES: DUF4153 domain-containing protein [Pseudoalteromonas]ATC87734.1 hypothetical protein PARC_a3345 [Pseudoalteromonas arctica A 37-1-2]MBB1296569.1 DUF4153 domain-containing protein [Pseudoalteromonas sp. SR41-7]MBB1377975.1 DUF4153 domain-containing protein [Pseudoalteromonas sp. SR43-2]MBB1451264.1 DUF4153 domain-containing protein [Pseudoalteromonas sp. SG43-1]MBH0002690.1 DUF4153 domain-containing protein [Pseudoalteromonas sp. SWYJZ12]|tara:strand:- start:101 stop:1810 length:1710 start_codon:yes stop_codon:yes gene_type:complete
MDSQLPKSFIIILAVLQAIALTLLYSSIENNVWPATSPTWLVSLITFSMSFPLLMLMTVNKNNIKTSLLLILPFSLLLSLLGAYVGFQQEPQEYVSNNTLMSVFIFTSLIAGFKGLMYIQQFGSSENVSYSRLFKLSWRNFIIFGECWLFVLIFWGILNLGAALFDILDIEFFSELLRNEWFWIPTLTLAFAFASVIFRKLLNIEDNIAFLLQTLIKFLLPVLSVISLGFLATLPFTGLNKLWETGSGSLLVMWLQVLTLFFVNTVYKDDSSVRPYHMLLHRLVFISVALLPVYSVISAYGIYLRVEQHGLTVDRCWGILIWFLLACFSFSYLVGIITKRDNWLEPLSKINIVMGWVVLVSMLAVNSPLLNFQSLSTNSQIARLDADKVTIEKFDYYYFEHSLGRQGYLAMQLLKQKIETSHPEQYAIIDRMYVNNEFALTLEHTVDDFIERSVFWPSQALIPQGLIEAVFSEQHFYDRNSLKEHTYYFIGMDLNKDDELDFIVIDESNENISAYFWLFDMGKWRSRYMNVENPEEIRYLKSMIDNNELSLVEPEYSNLKIGDVVFKVR